MADFVFDEATFDGEVQDAFAQDPFNVGTTATGAIAEALGVLRRAEKQACENDGQPAPTSYNVSVDRVDGRWKFSFASE